MSKQSDHTHAKFSNKDKSVPEVVLLLPGCTNVGSPGACDGSGVDRIVDLGIHFMKIREIC